MVRSWDLCFPLIERPRSQACKLRDMIQDHTEGRPATRTEGARGSVGCPPFCGLDIPLDILRREMCIGLIWRPSLFATSCAVAVDQVAWRARGRVTNVVTGAASGGHFDISSLI